MSFRIIQPDLDYELTERQRTHQLMRSSRWKNYADQVLHAIYERPEHRTLLAYQARTLRFLKKFFGIFIDKNGREYPERYGFSEGTVVDDWRRITNKDLMRGFKLSKKHCGQLIRDLVKRGILWRRIDLVPTGKHIESQRWCKLNIDRLEFLVGSEPPADSDEIGHLFRSMSDSVPMISDSYRSEATLRVCDKGVSGWSQGFHA